MSRDQLRGIGLILGTGGGSQDFAEEQYRLDDYRDLFEDPMGQEQGMG